MNAFRKSALTLVVVAAIPMFASSSAMAGVSASCNAATLSGLYNYFINGFNIVAGAPVAFSASGYTSYNGDGTLQGNETSVTTVKGKVVVSHAPYTGTYKITANCVIREIDKDPTNALSHYDEFTTPTGNSITFVETDPGVVSSGVSTRN